MRGVRTLLATGAIAAALLGAGPAAAQSGAPPETAPVVVTATRTPVPEGGAPGSLDVVTREQIEVHASPDIRAALGTVPSLVFNDSGSPAGVATLSLRASTSTQVLVLLDGRRLADAQSSFFSLNDLAVPVERIERVEVLPTPASALYGADALGGVVNIITRPPGRTPGAGGSVGFGSDGERRVAGGAQAGLGRIGLRADGQLRAGDGHRPNSDYDLTSFDLTAALPPEPWGMTLDWTHLQREAGAPGPESFPAPNARQDDDRDTWRAGFDYLPGGGWAVKGGVTAAHSWRRYDDPEPPAFAPGVPAEPIASRHENSSRGADLQWDFDTGAGELFTFGGEWAADKLASTNDGDHDTERWGVFAQDQWRSGSWLAVLAVRHDDHSVYGGQTSPSISIIYDAPGWRLWGSSARGYRAPNFDDLYWNDQFLQGNPDLKPETSWGWEGGLESRWDEYGSLRVAYFRRNVDDLIRWADLDGDFVYRAENVAEASVHGWEGVLDLRPAPGFRVPVSYQAISTEDEATGEQLPGAVRKLWRVGAEYTEGTLTWALTWSRTERGRFQYREAAWEYAVVDASMTWRGTLGGLPTHASLRLENLRDREYETVEGYPMPGRSWFLEVGISL
jgi:outer membrane cobalamin receptor